MSEIMRFPEQQLDFIESRVLGSLLEKETTTPDYYPLTLKAIEAACNQSSNRYPVTRLSSEEVGEAVQRLRQKEIIIQVHISGSRAPRYEHQLSGILDLTSPEKAVITVLLLRSIQTAGEIKQRCERMHPFESVGQVEEILKGFMEYSYGPLVKEIPVGEGRRVKTYGHLLGGEKSFEADTRFKTDPPNKDESGLEKRVALLEGKLAQICEQLGIEEG
jgi:uncharacterized protein YceH (UPF0502 family)